MGRADWYHSRLEIQGTLSSDAGDQHTRNYPGQAGSEEHVRVSCVQD